MPTGRADVAPTTPKPSRLYTLDEARERLGGVSRSKLYLEVDAGRLRLSRIGKRVFISDVELDRYLQSIA